MGAMAPIDSIPFGDRRIGPGHRVVLIAEVGINHEGDVDVCAEMIRSAGKAGADSIKLQTIDADENYVRGTESYELFSRAALSPDETARMFDLSRRLGMEPFTTAADYATVDWVEKLDPAAHKVSSGMMTNTPIVRYIAAKGRTMLISTGMAEVSEIDETIACSRNSGSGGLGIFQCTSEYPAPIETLNLSAMGWFRDRYGIPVGFSDHSLGIEAAVLSVAAGATMIEKHFTLDTTLPSFDHGISLDPAGFAALVTGVRRAETMLGTTDKKLSAAEHEKRALMHRILIARTPITAGDTFTSGNVGFKRPLPGTKGLPPRDYDDVLGRTARCDLAPDQAVTKEALGEEL
jgi:N,N'-diacetyllegionaminate synthase